MNKTEITREIAKRSRSTLFPMTVEQATTFMNFFLDVVAEEMCRPSGRIEMEGFIVMQQQGKSARAKLSPALKRQIARKLAKGQGVGEPA